MEVIADTNFLITCVKQKIDFFEYAKLSNMQVLIPEQVLTELSKIVASKQKLHVREAAALALKLIKISECKKIDIKQVYVDNGIINFVKENPSVAVATLDRGLQSRLTGRYLIIREKKRIEII